MKQHIGKRVFHRNEMKFGNIVAISNFADAVECGHQLGVEFDNDIENGHDLFDYVSIGRQAEPSRGWWCCAEELIFLDETEDELE